MNGTAQGKTKFLSLKSSIEILIGFASSFLSARNLFSSWIVCGGSLSGNFLEQPLPDWVPSGEGLLIVVMGGSQGAQKMNEMVRNVLPFLLEKGCRVVHLTGKNDCFYRDISKVKTHPNLVLRDFSNEISALLQNADLAISRAGSGAICELIVTKIPSILIPFPQSADNHQEVNAAYIARFGGAIIVNQHNPEEVTNENYSGEN